MISRQNESHAEANGTDYISSFRFVRDSNHAVLCSTGDACNTRLAHNMSAYRGANQGRKELSGFYKGKTDHKKKKLYKFNPRRVFVWKARSPR